jgi:hypothetical protein
MPAIEVVEETIDVAQPGKSSPLTAVSSVTSTIPSISSAFSALSASFGKPTLLLPSSVEVIDVTAASLKKEVHVMEQARERIASLLARRDQEKESGIALTEEYGEGEVISVEVQFERTNFK